MVSNVLTKGYGIDNSVVKKGFENNYNTNMANNINLVKNVTFISVSTSSNTDVVIYQLNLTSTSIVEFNAICSNIVNVPLPIRSIIATTFLTGKE